MIVPVSIVIPVHNGAQLLRQLLASISRQSVEPAEVLVVDNGSTDDAAEVAVRMGARILPMGRNAGFAAAVNRGIQAAQGEAIALINSDVEIDPRWLELLWHCLGSHNFVTGKILQAASPELLDGSYDLISRAACSWRAGAGRPAAAMSEPVEIRFCSATAALYRASIFQKAGGFDETFESYLEDVDFGLRCAGLGLTGWYFPDAICRHHGSATFGRWSPRVVRLIARNQIFLVARHYPSALIRHWLWPILWGQLLWGALALRHGCGLAYFAGKFEGLRRCRQIRGVTTGLQDVVAESEREIYGLQSREGFDAYWKVYFRLT